MIDDLLSAVRSQMDAKFKSPRHSIFSSRFDTSDVKQDSLIQVWQELETKGLENVPITNAWLRTIGNGHFCNHNNYHLAAKRSIKCEQTAAPHAVNEKDPATLAEFKEQVGRLRFVVSLLSERDKRILRLRFFEQMSFNEIAKTVDSPPHCIRRRFYSILHRLRDQLS